MSMTFTYTVTGLAQAQAKIASILRQLGQPESGLVAATHKVADVFARNYDTEGTLVGGWADLAERTQATRAYQNGPFDPDHPIMIRYGSLRAVAVEFFQKANSGASTTVDRTSGPTWSDQSVSGSLDISGGTAKLSLAGSYKLLNQFGYPDTNGSGNNPARPFWFINQASIAAARQGVVDWIENEVLR